MTGTATIVPSNRESYDIGHVYLVKNEADFRKYVNDQAANVTEQARLDKKPTFDKNATVGEIADANAVWTASQDGYYNQEGCKKGLRHVILKTVPESLIRALKHRQH